MPPYFECSPACLSMPLLRRTAVLAAALALAGCGGSDRMTVRTADAESALRTARESIRDAERNGADADARDPLDTARTRLDRAESALQSGNNDLALRLAREADVTAELAEVMAQSAKSKAAAREVRQTIDLLRDEIRRLQSE